MGHRDSTFAVIKVHAYLRSRTHFWKHPMRISRPAVVASLASCLVLIGIVSRVALGQDAARLDVERPNPMLGKEAGQVRNDNVLKMRFVWCPPGKFKMGSPESEPKRSKKEGPQVDVILTSGFWLAKFEATQQAWGSLMETTPWKGQDAVQEGDDVPATFVNWEDAAQFCEKMTEVERKAGRLPKDWVYTLPTEAQWEYACRAGTTTRYSFGDDASQLNDYAWFGRFYGEDGVQNIRDELYAHEVALKKPNPWGLYEMHGNVWEWCRDWYGAKVEGGTDPTGPASGSEHVIRGGSFVEASWMSTSARREGPMAQKRNNGRRNFVGFRVACVPTPRK